MKNDDFEASVGMTRKWDAREAGREVARNTIRKLKRPPSFFLLFSTIHYEKNGGFQEFLDGVWDVLPKGTPLIGGTIAGFINPEGCFVRGASAMAVSARRIDISLGIGYNTKRNPKRAARECSSMIQKGLKNSNYPNKWFISFVSGGKVPSFPIIGKKHVVDSFIGLKFFLIFFNKLCSLLQIGPGRDEDVLEGLSNNLKKFRGIAGTSCDELKLERNTQFFMKKTVTNSIVSLGISSDKDVKFTSATGLTPSGIKFTIDKKGGGGYILKKINKDRAVDEYLKLMGWPKEVLDERLYRKVFYYPFIQKTSNRLSSPRMLGLVYGDEFISAAKPLDEVDAEIFTSTGKSMIESVNDLFKDESYEFAFLISCGTKMETLGNNIYNVKKILDKKLGDDYLLLYVGGEFTKISDDEFAFMYQSDNALLM